MADDDEPGISQSLHNVTVAKAGAFRDWTETNELVEISLPLPATTTKKDLACVISSDKLHVRHVLLRETLLRAEPLAGPVMSDESTWYLDKEHNVLVISLAKQWRKETNADQYWGASLAAPDGVFECYMSAKDVAIARAAREELEKEREQQRRARVQASQREHKAKRDLAKEQALHRRAPRSEPTQEASSGAPADDPRFRDADELQRELKPWLQKEKRSQNSSLPFLVGAATFVIIVSWHVWQQWHVWKQMWFRGDPASERGNAEDDVAWYDAHD